MGVWSDNDGVMEDRWRVREAREEKGSEGEEWSCTDGDREKQVSRRKRESLFQKHLGSVA